MKKIIVGIVATFSLAFPRSSYYSINGATRTVYAYPEDQGILYIHLFHAGAGYAQSEIPLSGFSGLGFAPFSFAELSLTTSIEGTYRQEGSYIIGPLFLSPWLKLGYPFLLSPSVGFFIAPGFSTNIDIPLIYINEAGTQAVSSKTPYYTFKGILGMGTKNFSFHINAGYTLSPDTPRSYIPYSIAIDFSPIRKLSFILDFSNGADIDKISSFDNALLGTLIRMSTGQKEGVTFDIGAEIGMGTNTPKWKGFLGISVSFDVIEPPKEPVAIIIGKVIDAETGEPIQASIKFPDSPVEPVLTDPKTGDFSLKLPPGVYRVRAEAKGYKWKEKGVILKDGDKKFLDFQLNKKIVATARLVGKVTDYSTKKPIEGVKISFSGTKIPSFYTDALGIYKAEVPEGSYTVVFEKEGYSKEIQPVVLEKGKGKELNISLVRTGTRFRFQNIYFRPGSAYIEPASYPVLADVVNFLKEHPNVIIEIQGHTDSVGSFETNMRLSQRRAEAVKAYLVSQGISPHRLIARGYGETRPIGDNRTREGRRLNRRIEFVVITQ